MLAVEGLVKRFGGLTAVDGCSFEIAKGSITGLVGPNGAGKTTTFNIISGDMVPTSGRVRFDGADVTGVPTHRLFHRGLVRTFQIPQEYRRMTARENLMVAAAGQSGEQLFPAWLQRGRVAKEEADVRRRADDALAFLNLAHVADELAGNLSGGQKKLLEIGRTMMSEARLVLLDEPGAGVNPTLLKEVAGAIRRLNRERGYTFCIIEHNMDLIAELCDPVIVMAEGRVLRMGTIDEIRADRAVIDAYLGGARESAA
ncbi:MAG: ABC transporter ATP-binding protein [Hyphomicrobiales bacterium]|nr:ABC transporter ATP-binding protein [Hyphomicrobiales bacterium]